MERSFDVLQTATTARLKSAPVSLLPGPRTASECVLEGMRQRNALLDWMFYDVGVVTDAEATRLGPSLAAEGAMLIVPPSGGAPLSLCCSIDEFIANGGAEVRTLVVAGVGSSALGAAALGRNVADAIGSPVAAVVSGYGLADLASEALGGFFWFGTLNAIRHSFEWLDRERESGLIDDPDGATSPLGVLSMVRGSKDTRTVRHLLTHPDLSFDLLVGHSKGNLVLSEALFAIQAQQPARLKALARKIRIVTLSAKIAMPSAFKTVIDVMGQIDILGALNSRLTIPADVMLRGVGHHTNTDIFGRLPVTATLAQLQRDGRI